LSISPLVLPAYTEDSSFINDQASEDGQTSASSDPLQDEAAWDILEEYLTSDTSFPQTETKLISHLGSRYREEDWTEAKRALFSADEDNTEALKNLRAIKVRHILSPAKVAGPLRGSCNQSARAWLDKVADLESRFTQSSGSLRAHAPPSPPPSPPPPPHTNTTVSGLSRADASQRLVASSSDVARRTIKRFIENEISSSHAYHLLEVEFSDNPTSMIHWESVMDAIVDAITREARLQIFDMRTSDIVEPAMSSAASSVASVQPLREIGVFEESISSTQDVGTASAPDLPTWLVTVPCE
jgi:hypothetical protein